MLRDWAGDIATSLGAFCNARSERLLSIATRWNRRAKWFADAAEWLTTHKTWREVRHGRGRA